jgi:short-subunit dehydrogenase
MRNINTTGLILLTKHALRLLKQSQGAAIMNVSSGLGLIAMPFYALYAATKAAVRQS